MKDSQIELFYKVFGRLVRTSRESRPDTTQEKLGQLVGLSRTSITNIEQGRQHVALHQFFAIAEALKVRPDALLPQPRDIAVSSWVAGKLPPGTGEDITAWAEKLVRD